MLNKYWSSGLRSPATSWEYVAELSSLSRRTCTASLKLGGGADGASAWFPQTSGATTAVSVLVSTCIAVASSWSDESRDWAVVLNC